MTKFLKISNLLILGILIVICGLGTFYKHISFGLGLGDMIGYLVLYIGTITHIVLTIKSHKKGRAVHLIFILFFSIFTALIMLKATIWRGSEYKWNGSIFYLPCSQEIKIENSKNVLIQMCTGQYDSEFSGIWNKKYIIITKDDLKIPEKLNTYLKTTIDKVEIESDFHEGSLNKSVYYFKKDTLKVNTKYSMFGEIIAVKDSIPVMKVRIKKQ
tara:strand:- start:620 stop:1261 length:642 start_codon:yes stop_codon:yes gene_type:complete